MGNDEIERFYKRLNISSGEKMHDGGIYDSGQYMEHGVYKKYSFLKPTPVTYSDSTSSDRRECDA